MNLKNSIFKGVFWTAVEVFFANTFSFIIKLVLAKLLLPEDFGLVAQVAIFINFITVINELGFGSALVQKDEKLITEVHFHTIFWTSLVWAIFLFLVIFYIITPFTATFFNEPIINKIMPVMAIGILISPITLVSRTKLVRDLKFKQLSFATIVSSILTGIISLTLAFMGYGVWSLVFNFLISIVVSTPIYFYYVKWLPKPIWGKKAFLSIFDFGVKTLGTNLFNTLISQLDNILIGKILGTQALGIYGLSFTITDIFRSQIMGIMNKVMFPVYSKIQNNNNQLVKYYLNVVKINTAVVYPIMLVLILFAEPLILSVYGYEWEKSILPIKLLSTSVLFHMLVSSNTSLIRAIGRPGLELKLQLIKSLLVFTPLMLIGVHYFGINGAATAVIIHKIIAVFIAQYVLNKYFNLKFTRILKELRNIIISFVISLIICGLIHFYFPSFWIINIGLSLTIYSLIIYSTEKKLIKNELTNYLTKKQN